MRKKKRSLMDRAKRIALMPAHAALGTGRLLAARADEIVVIMGLGFLCAAAFAVAYAAGLATVGLSLMFMGSDIAERMMTGSRGGEG
jgi:hypothetical protein